MRNCNPPFSERSNCSNQTDRQAKRPSGKVVVPRTCWIYVGRIYPLVLQKNVRGVSSNNPLCFYRVYSVIYALKASGGSTIVSPSNLVLSQGRIYNLHHEWFPQWFHSVTPILHRVEMKKLLVRILPIARRFRNSSYTDKYSLISIRRTTEWYLLQIGTYLVICVVGKEGAAI